MILYFVHATPSEVVLIKNTKNAVSTTTVKSTLLLGSLYQATAEVQNYNYVCLGEKIFNILNEVTDILNDDGTLMFYDKKTGKRINDINNVIAALQLVAQEHVKDYRFSGFGEDGQLWYTNKERMTEDDLIADVFNSSTVICGRGPMFFSIVDLIRIGKTMQNSSTFQFDLLEKNDKLIEFLVAQFEDGGSVENDAWKRFSWLKKLSETLSRAKNNTVVIDRSGDIYYKLSQQKNNVLEIRPDGNFVFVKADGEERILNVLTLRRKDFTRYDTVGKQCVL